MMTLLRALVALVLTATSAAAMNQSSVPPKFPIPWAASAGAAYSRSIPQNSQIGIQNCAASLTDGFPPLTFVPSVAGGCPPFGADFNGILKQLSQWGQWQAAGSPTVYDSAFGAQIGGYPKGATISSATTAGCYWISQVDSNGSNPETGGANWTWFCAATNGDGVPTSGGSANSQTVSVPPFTLRVGSIVKFLAAYTNNAALQVNVNGAGFVNVLRRSQLGWTLTVGGEVQINDIVELQWDGSAWRVMSAPNAIVGSFVDFGAGSTPFGYVVGGGQCVPQTGIYADAYAVLGNQYGSCPSGQFALPDFRGRVSAALDTQGPLGAANRLTSGGSACAGGTIGAGCGGQTNTIQQANLPAVSPIFTGALGGVTVVSQVSNVLVGTPIPNTQYNSNGVSNTGTVIPATFGSGPLSSSGTYTPAGTISPLGSGAPFGVVQPTIIVVRMIKL